MFVLNKFIESYERSTKKPMHTLDESRAVVRLFQSKVLKLAKKTIPEKPFISFKKWTDGTNLFLYRFYAELYMQFVDYLNLQWIALDPVERPKKLHLYAKCLNQYSSKYERFEKRIHEVAEIEGVSPKDIRYGDYESVEIIW